MRGDEGAERGAGRRPSLSLHVLVEQVLLERVRQHQLLVYSVQSGFAHLHPDRSSADVFQRERLGWRNGGRERIEINTEIEINKRD